MNWIKGLRGGPFSKEQTAKLVEIFSGLTEGQLQWLSGYFAGLNAGTYQELSLSQALNISGQSEPLWILYGTHTGNSEKLANQMAKQAHDHGMESKVQSMAKFKPREIKNIEKLAMIVSTHGNGDPPVMAEELYQFLNGKKAPKLDRLKYSVLALGDTGYTEFCQTGKDFDKTLETLGAKRIYDRVDCDVDYEDAAAKWIQETLKNFKTEGNGHHIVVNEPDLPVKEPAPTLLYTRKNPFEAEVLEKINLNGRGSSKETVHLELNLEGSGLTYEPGDALGIYALNSQILVDHALEALNLSGDEDVETHTGIKKLSDALVSDYELTPLTSVVLNRYVEITGIPKLKEILEDKKNTAQYLYGRDVIDIFKEFPYKLRPLEFISLLRKNTPRMYSIASSQSALEDEVHLLVAVVRYEMYERHKEGHCSCYMADRVLTDETLKVFVDHNSRFKLPEDPETPIIMIGPGTGVAPFRAFIQQREMEDQRGKTWLFFGDRNFTTDFLYQTEWQAYLKDGILTKMDVAFSRDQKEKIYVQHKMLEKGKELYQWLEEGAHFYVCGDAERMAKDVDNTLKEILRVHGSLSTEKAEDYVKYLQVSDRYQTDVY